LEEEVTSEVAACKLSLELRRKFKASELVPKFGSERCPIRLGRLENEGALVRLAIELKGEELIPWLGFVEVEAAVEEVAELGGKSVFTTGFPLDEGWLSIC